MWSVIASKKTAEPQGVLSEPLLCVDGGCECSRLNHVQLTSVNNCHVVDASRQSVNMVWGLTVTGCASRKYCGRWSTCESISIVRAQRLTFRATPGSSAPENRRWPGWKIGLVGVETSHLNSGNKCFAWP